MTAFLRLPPMHPERAIEWMSRGIMTLWGLQLLAIPSLFNDTDKVYDGLLSLAPQQVWGLGSFSIGLIGLGALYINGQHFRTPSIRVGCSFASMFIWFWVFMGLWRLDTWQTGLPVYFGLMMADLWSVYRASIDVTTARDMHKKLKVVSGVMRSASTGC